ncbi:hypothetical protein MUK42_22726 [Musa troglodytarum]|uniref:Uncharacterized protein n=1 Tax=Musa troglodytarum TaxID=320322 RepID=A0A9E7KRY2_9LILI|nr:hypothetical protein MUK42_22726 [Musa troglodytarum]
MADMLAPHVDVLAPPSDRHVKKKMIDQSTPLFHVEDTILYGSTACADVYSESGSASLSSLVSRVERRRRGDERLFRMDSQSIGRSGYGFEKDGFSTDEQRRVMRGDPAILCRFRKPMEISGRLTFAVIRIGAARLKNQLSPHQYNKLRGIAERTKVGMVSSAVARASECLAKDEDRARWKLLTQGIRYSCRGLYTDDGLSVAIPRRPKVGAMETLKLSLGICGILSSSPRDGGLQNFQRKEAKSEVAQWDGYPGGIIEEYLKSSGSNRAIQSEGHTWADSEIGLNKGRGMVGVRATINAIQIEKRNNLGITSFGRLTKAIQLAVAKLVLEGLARGKRMRRDTLEEYAIIVFGRGESGIRTMVHLFVKRWYPRAEAVSSIAKGVNIIEVAKALRCVGGVHTWRYRDSRDVIGDDMMRATRSSKSVNNTAARRAMDSSGECHECCIEWKPWTSTYGAMPMGKKFGCKYRESHVGLDHAWNCLSSHSQGSGKSEDKADGVNLRMMALAIHGVAICLSIDQVLGGWSKRREAMASQEDSATQDRATMRGGESTDHEEGISAMGIVVSWYAEAGLRSHQSLALIEESAWSQNLKKRRRENRKTVKDLVDAECMTKDRSRRCACFVPLLLGELTPSWSDNFLHSKFKGNEKANHSSNDLMQYNLEEAAKSTEVMRAYLGKTTKWKKIRWANFAEEGHEKFKGCGDAHFVTCDPTRVTAWRIKVRRLNNNKGALRGEKIEDPTKKRSCGVVKKGRATE